MLFCLTAGISLFQRGSCGFAFIDVDIMSSVIPNFFVSSLCLIPRGVGGAILDTGQGKRWDFALEGEAQFGS